jgi:hypothetical protein
VLLAIFVPIVHKNSFKKPVAIKNVINAFIARQLLFLLEYLFYLVNGSKILFRLHFPILKYTFSAFSAHLFNESYPVAIIL